MKIITLTASTLAIAALSACSGSEVEANTNKAAQGVEKVQEKTEVLAKETTAADYDFSAIPAGTYNSESTHAYITFQYLHQGYSRPTIRWNDFEAIVELNTEDPGASTVSVSIDPASIDSGVEKFDTHLKSADMFDVEKYPAITFKSTEVNLAAGTLSGDLTIKETTKPVTLDVALNKVGESRKGAPMFGISGTTQIKRSDWDVGYAVPFVGDDVDIIIEIEFQKAE